MDARLLYVAPNDVVCIISGYRQATGNKGERDRHENKQRIVWRRDSKRMGQACLGAHFFLSGGCSFGSGGGLGAGGGSGGGGGGGRA
jgi:hypothetical protein